MRLETAEVSLLGDRDENQDRAAVHRDNGSVLLVVADGMGGHSGGSLAAEIAVDGRMERARAREIVAALYRKAARLFVRQEDVTGEHQPELAVMWGLEQLVRIDCEDGRRTKAIETLLGAVQLPLRHAHILDLQVRAARLCVEEGDHARAIDLYRRVLEERNDDLQLVTELAALCDEDARIIELISMRTRELELSGDAERKVELRLELSRLVGKLESRGGRVESLRANLDERPGHRASVDAIVDVEGEEDLISFRDLLRWLHEGRRWVTLADGSVVKLDPKILEPVAEAARIAHEAGALLLCDAVQAAGKMPLDFVCLGADMMMLAGHKLGAPMGVGALVIREGLSFAALAVGGGQEMRRRAGSENVSGIAGFGAAAAAALAGLDDFAALARLRDRLEAEIAAYAPDAVFFGGKAERLANTCYVAAPGLDAETMLMALDLDGIAVSAGAACSSGKVGSPRVLDAMGVPPALSKGAIRVSLGWTSEPGDVDRFVASWARAYERAKAKVKTNVNAGAPRPLASVES